MRKLLFLFSFLTVLTFGSTAASNAKIAVITENPPYDLVWTFLGDKKVNSYYDRDQIVIRPEAGYFKAIRLKTNHPGVNIDKVMIYYANGERERLYLKSDYRGQESHTIDLKGRFRAIDRVVFWGSWDGSNSVFRQRRGQGRRGIIELWGLSEVRDYDRRYNRNYDRNYCPPRW